MGSSIPGMPSMMGPVPFPPNWMGGPPPMGFPILPGRPPMSMISPYGRALPPMPNRGIPHAPFGYIVPPMVGPPMQIEENPDDWTEHTDKTSGRIYYYNKKIKQSKWTKPIGFLNQKEKLTPVSSQKIADTDWCVVFTRGGQSYYHNDTTKETTWTLPDSLNTPKPISEKGKPNR